MNWAVVSVCFVHAGVGAVFFFSMPGRGGSFVFTWRDGAVIFVSPGVTGR